MAEAFQHRKTKMCCASLCVIPLASNSLAVSNSQWKGKSATKRLEGAFFARQTDYCGSGLAKHHTVLGQYPFHTVQCTKQWQHTSEPHQLF